MILHSKENNQESEQHLKSNGEKFQGDCLIVMRLLYSGYRLTARRLEKEFDIDGRRLRDCYAARKDIIKKEWVKEQDGKTKYMEYFIDVPKQTTKNELQEWFTEYQSGDYDEPLSSESKPTTNPHPIEKFSQLNLF